MWEWLKDISNLTGCYTIKEHFCSVSGGGNTIINVIESLELSFGIETSDLSMIIEDENTEIELGLDGVFGMLEIELESSGQNMEIDPILPEITFEIEVICH